jgi:ATP/ADP translocase
VRREPGRAAQAEEPLSADSAFALLARDRFLLLLAGLTLLLNWVNSNGEYILDRTLLATLAREGHTLDAAAFIGRFKADYFGWVNVCGMVLQLFVVSRVLTRLGVRAALFFLPIVALGGYGVLLAAPVLALIRVAKIAENSLDYSIQNTARQALYLVATRAEKFVGKTAVDTFFVRFGDVLSAGLVWLGVRFALSTSTFAMVNVALIAAWIVVVLALGREHRRRSNELGFEVVPRGRTIAGVIALVLVAFSPPARADSPKPDVPDCDGRGPGALTLHLYGHAESYGYHVVGLERGAP